MKLVKASLWLMIGVSIGLLLLEGILHANPRLLLKGMGLPAPVDPPLQTQTYDVRYTDADLFYWHSNLIRPISAEANKLEAQVTYITDELGFPNQAPLSSNVDVVVLGRSYSMGAQSAYPWPRLLNDKFGLSVLNLSQPGSSIDTKYQYFARFGLKKSPRWVIVEVLPSMDIIGYEDNPRTLLQNLPVPIIQQVARLYQKKPVNQENSVPIYPLAIHIPKRDMGVSFFSYYLAALTVDRTSLIRSNQWRDYQKGLTSLIKLAQSNHACLAILFVPTKENLYFQLSEVPSELQPALDGWYSWKLSENNKLFQDGKIEPDVNSMISNANAGRDVVADFAEQHLIPFIDPTQLMADALIDGEDPFMVYDTHWSAAGHTLVADLVAQTLQNAGCP